jgi:predicted nucleic acid-binding protein
MARISYIYCDSCVFLAYFNAEINRIDVLETIFAQVKQDKNKKFITSVLTIAEVAHTYQEKNKRMLKAGLENMLDSFWSDEDLLEIADMSEIVARQARTLLRLAIGEGYGLKPPDAIHLATASLVNAEKFITYDDLGRYARWVEYPILSPEIGI